MAISNASNQIVEVNLIPGTVPSVLQLSQYDTGAGRPITFSVYDGSQVFAIPSGVYIAFEGTKPDGKGFSFTCSKSGSNALLTNYTNQMTALPGKIMCQLVFTDTSGGRVGSLPVLMVVTPAGINGDTVISDSDIEAIVAAQNQYAILNARINNLVGNTGNSNSEIVDARVGVDGTAYTILGTAIRSQVNDLKGDLSQLSEEIANLSGGLNSTASGLNSTAKSLLITILRDGIYNTNQSANITALSVALENTGGDSTSVPTESISITGDTTVNFGESLILTATLTPSNTTDSVVWTSSNEKIATVTGRGSKNTVGTVTGIKGGTVTIRAMAGSISTTYTVTVVENINISLPDGYTALDYIVSNWKSSFDTGITADENTSAEYKISFIKIGAVHFLADNGAYAFPTSSNGGSVRSKRGGTDYNYSYTLSTDTIYTIKAFAENSVNVNGTNIDTKSVVGNIPSGNGTLIFNNYGSTSNPYGSTAKYYYMKIWEGETLVRLYIPCKDVNGTVGMYDVVGNTFNGSSGETFTEV